MPAGLLAEIRTGQKHLKEEMLAKKKANQERMEADYGNMMAKLDAHHERMMARMDSQLQKTEVYPEKTGSEKK
jgi:hypothetical protein